jgi:hypothetical protein
MAFINESLNNRHDSDAKISISPWVISALNHIVSASQPPDTRDKSVRTSGVHVCFDGAFQHFL